MADLRFEYATTTGMASGVQYAESPRAPDGAGWEMVGSAAVPMSGANYDIALFWFWRRPIDRSGPCECGAIARRDGKCLGCNKELRA